MKDKNIPYDLIMKYLSGNCNDKEAAELEKWKNESEDYAREFDQMSLTWDNSTPPKVNVDVDKALENISDRLGKQEKKHIPIRRIVTSVAAAVAIAIVSLGILKKTNTVEEVIIVSLKNSNPTRHELPDGSIITLNKGSMLTHPEKFSKTERRISFRGEAYFDIAPDANRPFIIDCGITETRVLGTEFNLFAIEDSVVQVTVTEGLVSLALKNQKEEKITLEVGQVGEYNSKSNQLDKHKNDNPNFLSWRNGKFRFVNQELSSALEQIGNYYNVSFELGDSSLGTTRFNAQFDSLTIEEALNDLSLILDIEISFSEGKYLLKERS